MKLSKKARIRIRKAVAFARILFFALGLICLSLSVCSVDGPNFTFPMVCLIIGVLCLGVSYLLDRLLW